MGSRAEYYRSYRANGRQRLTVREQLRFTEGAEAMRDAAMELFAGIASGEMTGYTAASIMKSINVSRATQSSGPQKPVKVPLRPQELSAKLTELCEQATREQEFKREFLRAPRRKKSAFIDGPVAQ